ncbi:fibronectin type III domain-containing protein 7 [Amia ocellicauda]|uniref:fibronectin type III domain-containing protein 7 n=1 Tax=Amia ocellicauda TaxID=2972642 RepID=UPI00346469EF
MTKMGTNSLSPFKLIVFLSMCMSQISEAQRGMSVSVFTVTSKSIVVRWTQVPGVHSYKVTATPKNAQVTPVFSQFNGAITIGSVIYLIPDTIYNMKVEAIDSNGLVLAQAEVLETTAPDVPSIDQAYSKLSNSITVEWNPVPGASAYTLRAEDGISVIETSVTGSPGTVSNLKPATQYIISVMSVNAGGRSQPSVPKKAKTVLSAPILHSSSPSNSSIVVTWEPVYMAVGYTFSIIQTKTGQRVNVNTSQTNITFTNLEPGTIYSIKGNAWDSSNTLGDDYTISQITRPEIPQNVQVSLNGRSVGAMVTWTSVEGADNFTAANWNGQNCSYSFPSPPSSTVNISCDITPLLCGQQYSITVVARNRAGPSQPSAPEKFLTFPCAPENITIEEPNPGNLTVSWIRVTYAEYYVAFVKSDDGIEEQCNTTQTRCEFHCLCGFTYFVSVFAYNSAGQSPIGNVLNYTTAPCCPGDVMPAFVSGDTLEITWSPVRGAEVYQTKAADGTSQIHCNDTATVCALSALQCNTRFSLVVTSCNEVRGCNTSCKTHYAETAPCSPEILSIAQASASSFNISWSTNNKEANYTVRALGMAESHTCRTSGRSCQITGLPCGSTYDVSAIAITSVGQSLPSYTRPLETGPCCPNNLTVTQATQAMTNVTWSTAKGAQSYITMLKSPRGEAKCHTLQTHCLLGCITCGTNYTVSLQAISGTGHMSECTFHGFSSSACCPSNVRLYRMSNNTIRVYWRSSGNLHNYTADLYGTSANYTCTPPQGLSSCDISEISCGDVYSVVVAPVSMDGSKVKFCPRKMYSVSCSGNNVGMVIYRGKRSVD